MTPDGKNVLDRVSLMTESLLKQLVSSVISTVQHKRGLTDKAANAARHAAKLEREAKAAAIREEKHAELRALIAEVR